MGGGGGAIHRGQLHHGWASGHPILGLHTAPLSVLLRPLLLLRLPRNRSTPPAACNSSDFLSSNLIFGMTTVAVSARVEWYPGRRGEMCDSRSIQSSKFDNQSLIG